MGGSSEPNEPPLDSPLYSMCPYYDYHNSATMAALIYLRVGTALKLGYCTSMCSFRIKILLHVSLVFPELLFVI